MLLNHQFFELESGTSGDMMVVMVKQVAFPKVHVVAL